MLHENIEYADDTVVRNPRKRKKSLSFYKQVIWLMIEDQCLVDIMTKHEDEANAQSCLSSASSLR